MIALRNLLAAVLLAPLLLAQAQPYPNQPIRLINPYAAGGPADLLAREMANAIGPELGQQLVIENKPGAGSTIGADFVAKSRPDGYTLLLSGSPSHIIVPAMQAKPLYDGIKDFTPIVMFVTAPNVIVTNPSRPYNNLGDLIGFAKANPAKVTYGSAGNGSIGHLATELLARRAGISMVHVPYKGAAPVVTDLLGGQIDVATLQLSAVLPHIKSGKMKAVAMATRNRSSLLPELATVHESGLSGFDAGTWWAFMGPAGMPREAVNKVHQAVVKAMGSAELRAKLLQNQGVETTLKGPDELLAQMREEHASLTALIKSAGLKME